MDPVLSSHFHSGTFHLVLMIAKHSQFGSNSYRLESSSFGKEKHQQISRGLQNSRKKAKVVEKLSSLFSDLSLSPFRINQLQSHQIHVEEADCSLGKKYFEEECLGSFEETKDDLLESLMDNKSSEGSLNQINPNELRPKTNLLLMKIGTGTSHGLEKLMSHSGFFSFEKFARAELYTLAKKGDSEEKFVFRKVKTSQVKQGNLDLKLKKIQRTIRELEEKNDKKLLVYQLCVEDFFSRKTSSQTIEVPQEEMHLFSSMKLPKSSDIQFFRTFFKVREGLSSIGIEENCPSRLVGIKEEFKQNKIDEEEPVKKERRWKNSGGLSGVNLQESAWKSSKWIFEKGENGPGKKNEGNWFKKKISLKKNPKHKEPMSAVSFGSKTNGKISQPRPFFIPENPEKWGFCQENHIIPEPLASNLLEELPLFERLSLDLNRDNEEMPEERPFEVYSDPEPPAPTEQSNCSDEEENNQADKSQSISSSNSSCETESFSNHCNPASRLVRKNHQGTLMEVEEGRNEKREKRFSARIKKVFKDEVNGESDDDGEERAESDDE